MDTHDNPLEKNPYTESNGFSAGKIHMEKTCERCKALIAEGEERIIHGRLLCEDCCMDLLSPAKACDPWAVYSAKTFVENQKNGPQLNPAQQKVLDLLQENGPMELATLCQQLQLSPADLERELATLRHMEKIRGELINGVRHIRIWEK